MTAILKSKQTSIATVRYHLLPVASLLTPLIFHYPLPLKTHLCSKMHFFPKIHETNSRDEALNNKCFVLNTILRKSSLTCVCTVHTGKYFVIFKVLCICTVLFCYKKRFCVTTVMFPCEVRVIGTVRRYVMRIAIF
jgi:hypothetical protein